MPNCVTPRESCVLIVDQSDESREVLRTALERRGVQIVEAPELQRGLELARSHPFDVIVVDVEEVADQESLCTMYDDTSSRPASLVVLGTRRRVKSDSPVKRFVTKPYHYAALIRTIEQLLKR